MPWPLPDSQRIGDEAGATITRRVCRGHHESLLLRSAGHRPDLIRALRNVMAIHVPGKLTAATLFQGPRIAEGIDPDARSTAMFLGRARQTNRPASGWGGIGTGRRAIERPQRWLGRPGRLLARDRALTRHHRPGGARRWGGQQDGGETSHGHRKVLGMLMYAHD